MARERTSPRPTKSELSRFSPDREAWLEIDGLIMYHMVDLENEPGRRRYIRIRKQNGSAVTIGLDNMRLAELEIFGDFIARACRMAADDALLADKAAAAALEAGDDTVLRNYRADPRVQYRKPVAPPTKSDDDGL